MHHHAKFPNHSTKTKCQGPNQNKALHIFKFPMQIPKSHALSSNPKARHANFHCSPKRLEHEMYKINNE